MKKLILILAVLFIGVGSSYAYSGCAISGSAPYIGGPVGGTGYFNETTYVNFSSYTQIFYSAQVTMLGYISLKVDDRQLLTMYNYSSTNGFVGGPSFIGYTKFTLYMENGYNGPNAPAGAVTCTVLY